MQSGSEVDAKKGFMTILCAFVHIYGILIFHIFGILFSAPSPFLEPTHSQAHSKCTSIHVFPGLLIFLIVTKTHPLLKPFPNACCDSL